MSALQLIDIDKRFGGVHALRGARLEVHHGEIMGLCGENGAGKSTLLKVLAGVYAHGSYSGSVIVEGKPRRLARPLDAIDAGIAVVHQELSLVPELTVAQNLKLAHEPGRFGLVDDDELEAAARRDLLRFGFGDRIDVSRPVKTLGIGLQQMVEIVRALQQDAKILVLDEPTAALTAHETQVLLGWLTTLRARGTAIVIVSHRLDEIFQVCDRITVLRDGRTAATLVTRETTPAAVVAAMIGRTSTAGTRRAPPALPLPPPGRPALELRDFHVPPAVGPISLALAPGEIVALCGAMGSGRTALLSGLFGVARDGTHGSVRVDGAEVRLGSPAQAIQHGLAFVPEDRKRRGIVPAMSVAQNLALPAIPGRLGVVDAAAETRLAERRIAALRIRALPADAIATLSGGNQQKVVLGKWLEHTPRVLLLDEPTRGVDVGAREEIYGLLEELAGRGVAILFASSDLAEVLRLARRALVLRDGRVAGELDGATASEAAIVHLSTGAARAALQAQRA